MNKLPLSVQIIIISFIVSIIVSSIIVSGYKSDIEELKLGQAALESYTATDCSDYDIWPDGQTLPTPGLSSYYLGE